MRWGRLRCAAGEAQARGRGSSGAGWLSVPMRMGVGGGGGGGAFLCCLWATEGTPGSRRAAGGENSLLWAKFRYCRENSALQQLFSCKIKTKIK